MEYSPHQEHSLLRKAASIPKRVKREWGSRVEVGWEGVYRLLGLLDLLVSFIHLVYVELTVKKYGR
jgi:hypothetical protein